MTFKERMEPLDKIFLSIPKFSTFAVGIATFFGLDLRFLWLPLLSYLCWIIYIYQYRGAYQLQKYEERSLIEKIRGFTYAFSIITTFILNIWFFSHSGLITYTPEKMIISFVVIALVGLFLNVVCWFVPNTLFSKQTQLFTNNQKEILHDILKEISVVSIYFSFLNYTVLNIAFLSSQISLGVSLFLISVAFVFSSLYFLKIYSAENKSRKLSQELALSLKKSRWLRSYSGFKRKV